MSKALILSDIHSNIVALEAIWREEKDSDLVYCAGDLVDYGPYPAEVLDWVRTHNVICVKGNHDGGLVHAFRSDPPASALPVEERAWRQHNAAQLSERAIQFLDELPMAVSFELDSIRYGMTHLYKNYEEVVSLHQFSEFAERTFDSPLPPRLVFGHTHRQGVRLLGDGRLWLNSGSVSYRRPDDPDGSAHYAIIVDGEITLKRLPYDRTPLRQAVSQVSLMEVELRAAHAFFGT